MASHAHRVLLLEDDELVRRIVSKMLAHLGFEVIAASSVAQARRLSEATRDISLFMADFGLSEPATGASFLRWASARWPQTPRILMSALGASMLAEHGIEDACDLTLDKPFDMAALERHLDALGRLPWREDNHPPTNAQWRGTDEQAAV